MKPDFNERTFEFCYNSDFCLRFKTLLAAYPFLPSQRQEHHLGYDVEMRLRDGTYAYSLFLQHKISHYCEFRSGSNAKFFDCYNGSYFRFPIDTAQHNTLVALDSFRGNAFYCAPCFHRRSELEGHFRNTSILNSSIWISPNQVGNIIDTDKHNITYEPAGSYGYFHSQNKKIEITKIKNEQLPLLNKLEIDSKYVVDFADELMEIMYKTISEEKVPISIRWAKPIEKVQYILGQVMKISWFVLSE